MKELMVKRWKLDQEQHEACKYGDGFDYTRRTADIECRPVEEDGYNFVAVEILKETEKALFVEIDMCHKCWLPKSTVKKVA